MTARAGGEAASMLKRCRALLCVVELRSWLLAGCEYLDVDLIILL